MDESQLGTALGDAIRCALDSRECVDEWRPHRTLATEESQLIVGVGRFDEKPEHVVFAGNVDASRAIGPLSLRIEVGSQLRRDEFISIDNQDPLIARRLNCESAGRLGRFAIFLGKSHDFATELSRNVERAVRTLHVTNDHLVEITDCLRARRNRRLCVISIYYYGYGHKIHLGHTFAARITEPTVCACVTEYTQI